jgi:hypothetical protein
MSISDIAEGLAFFVLLRKGIMELGTLTGPRPTSICHSLVNKDTRMALRYRVDQPSGTRGHNTLPEEAPKQKLRKSPRPQVRQIPVVHQHQLIQDQERDFPCQEITGEHKAEAVLR